MRFEDTALRPELSFWTARPLRYGQRCSKSWRDSEPQFLESKSGARGRSASYEKRPDQRMKRESVARPAGSFLRATGEGSRGRVFLRP